MHTKEKKREEERMIICTIVSRVSHQLIHFFKVTAQGNNLLVHFCDSVLLPNLFLVHLLHSFSTSPSFSSPLWMPLLGCSSIASCICFWFCLSVYCQPPTASSFTLCTVYSIVGWARQGKAHVYVCKDTYDLVSMPVRDCPPASTLPIATTRMPCSGSSKVIRRYTPRWRPTF